MVTLTFDPKEGGDLNLVMRNLYTKFDDSM